MVILKKKKKKKFNIKNIFLINIAIFIIDKIQKNKIIIIIKIIFIWTFFFNFSTKILKMVNLI